MPHTLARTLRRAGTHRVLTDRTLANLAADGDSRAPDALIARHQEAMCRVVAGVSGATAASTAASALHAARADVVAGLPTDRPPRLSLLASASAAAISAGIAPGGETPAGTSRLPGPERAALVLLGTMGLSTAATATVMGTTPEHVASLAATAEASLSGFPPAGPPCLDARGEVPPAGALAAHAARCPPCTAFTVERVERARALAAVAAVAVAAPAVVVAGSATAVAASGRPVPNVELAVLGTLGVAVVSIGATLGMVVSGPGALDVPPAVPAELLPYSVPLFPDVADAENVQLVGPPPRVVGGSAIRRGTLGGGSAFTPLAPSAPSPSPQPPPPTAPPRPSSPPPPPRVVPVAVRTPIAPERGSRPDRVIPVPVAVRPGRRERPEPARPKKLPPAVVPARVVVAPPAPPPPAPVATPPVATPPAARPPVVVLPPRRGRDHDGRGHDGRGHDGDGKDDYDRGDDDHGSSGYSGHDGDDHDGDD